MSNPTAEELHLILTEEQKRAREIRDVERAQARATTREQCRAKEVGLRCRRAAQLQRELRLPASGLWRMGAPLLVAELAALGYHRVGVAMGTGRNRVGSGGVALPFELPVRGAAGGLVGVFWVDVVALSSADADTDRQSSSTSGDAELHRLAVAVHQFEADRSFPKEAHRDLCDAVVLLRSGAFSSVGATRVAEEVTHTSLRDDLFLASPRCTFNAILETTPAQLVASPGPSFEEACAALAPRLGAELWLKSTNLDELPEPVESSFVLQPTEEMVRATVLSTPPRFLGVPEHSIEPPCLCSHGDPGLEVDAIIPLGCDCGAAQAQRFAG
eukprot:RCo013900